MKKLSIKDFHRFMRGPFATSIEKAYKSHNIFCEADLQAFAWRKIKSFLRTTEEAPDKFRVLNKPFLRDCEGTGIVKGLLAKNPDCTQNGSDRGFECNGGVYTLGAAKRDLE